MTKVLVLGSGLMGPAAAFNCLSDPEVAQVTVGDLSRPQLEACQRKLAGLPGADKLATALVDVSDRPATARLMAGFDTVLGALPGSASKLALRAALAAGVPLVDITRFADEELPEIRREVEAAGGFVMLGCGLEPGLTEIMARHLAEQLERTDELHIKCGGIPEQPAPPLGYKIVFGGRQLPLYESDALVVADGRLQPVPRYSGVEAMQVPGVGECEAWHEGFISWLLELEALKGLRAGTQKTVRWPGYAARVTVLKEIGLLSEEPVLVGGVPVVPKQLLDAVLEPRVRLEEGERDITIFRVEVVGEKDGRPCRRRIDMVDRYDASLGFTSMARTTAYTAAIIARMVARGDIRGRGALTPEKVITGPLFRRLVDELAAVGVHFDATAE